LNGAPSTPPPTTAIQQQQNSLSASLNDTPSTPATPSTSRQKKQNSLPAVAADVRNLPVLQDPSKWTPMEPMSRTNLPTLGTTDNSNTQFAILAIWAARRHGLPVEPTLKLIVKRFETGQNQDGTWSYHYRFGGGLPEGPAMNCVGLLGLAIGRGMAHDAAVKDGPPEMKAAGAVGQPGLAALLAALAGLHKQLAVQEAVKNGAKDQRILGGFVALDRHVGRPAGRIQGLPLVNLYLLWSIERVAVLYNLPVLGQKDWYRWGAEILVANQAPAGNWQAGLYPGSTPPCDTCLALLFLRRSNLASDLTGSLALSSANLAKDLSDKLPDPAETKAPLVAPPPILVEPTPPTPDPVTPALVEPAPRVPVAAPSPAPRQADTPARDGGGNTLLFVFLALLVLFLIGGGVLAFFLMRSRDEDDEEERPRKTKRKTGKAGLQSKPAKELRPKTRVRSPGEP